MASFSASVVPSKEEDETKSSSSFVRLRVKAFATGTSPSNEDDDDAFVVSSSYRGGVDWFWSLETTIVGTTFERRQRSWTVWPAGEEASHVIRTGDMLFFGSFAVCANCVLLKVRSFKVKRGGDKVEKTACALQPTRIRVEYYLRGARESEREKVTSRIHLFTFYDDHIFQSLS